MAHDTIDHIGASEDDLVLFCDTAGRETVGGRDNIIKLSARVIVKFGFGISPEEASNQRRAYELLHPHIVRVPQVYRYFQREIHMPPGEFDGQMLFPDYTLKKGYLIMEFVEGQAAKPDQYQSLAFDISLILKRFHEIHDDRPGPIGGGASRGMFWADDFPAFRSKVDLEDWINRRTDSSDTKISLDSTPLVFSHMDLTPRNILRLPDQSLCLLDWESAGFYPRQFELIVLQIRALDDEEALFNDKLSRSIVLSEEEKAHLGVIKEAWGRCQRYFYSPTVISNPPHTFTFKRPPRKKILRDPSTTKEN